MAVSLFLVWDKKLSTKKLKTVLAPFIIQLVLNAMWSPVFFGLKNMLLALVIIIFMLIYIVKTIKSFRGVSKIAAKMLYPYLAWVSFATLLNFSVWILNF